MRAPSELHGQKAEAAMPRIPQPASLGHAPAPLVQTDTAERPGAQAKGSPFKRREPSPFITPNWPTDAESVQRAAQHWQEIDLRFWPWKHFPPDEMASTSGLVYVDVTLMDRLEALREKLGGTPLSVTSGYRTKRHNLRVNGVSNSQHLYGRAVDISVENQNPMTLADAAIEVGFTTIIHYPGMKIIHLDVRPRPDGQIDEWFEPANAKWPPRSGRFDNDREDVRARVDRTAGANMRGVATAAVTSGGAVVGAGVSADDGWDIELTTVMEAVAQFGGGAVLLLVGYHMFRRRNVIWAYILDTWDRLRGRLTP